MNDDPVLQALRELPPERAGEGFARRVMARLEAEPRTPFPAPARWAALATAAALALALPLAIDHQRAAAARDRRVRLLDLARQQQSLAGELEALRQAVTAEKAPVIYLGGDDDTDLVLDLARLARLREQARPVPASYRSES